MKKKIFSFLLAMILICTSFINPNLMLQASAEESQEVVRISGAGRIDTSLAIADIYKNTLGIKQFETVVIATSATFADALPGSYLAYVENAPILLVSNARMNDVVDYVKANLKKGGKVYILGGTAAVSPELEGKLTDYAVDRLAGTNRYETNLMILDRAKASGGEIIVSTGKNFADSLSASAVKLPILMVKDSLTPDQKTFLKTMNPSKIHVAGGKSAVSADAAAELAVYGTVERVAGENRRETSIEIAKKFFTEPDAAVVASAANFPDGLCGGPLAAALNVPLILTASEKTNEADLYIAANNICTGYVLGGIASLNDNSIMDIFKLESADDIKEVTTKKGTIKVAVTETHYNPAMWEKVCDAFTAQTGIEVEFTCDLDIENILQTSIETGEFPDVVQLSTGRTAALTEQFIANHMITDITDVLSMKVPGENVMVSEKLAGGFTETSLTNPYGDGKTYLAPMFYSPCGLFYNAALLEEKGWSVPTTWEEMWKLGDQAAKEGIYLFTYPTAGYLDSMLYCLMYSVGGAEFFNEATQYEDGSWESAEALECLKIMAKLATYTHPLTPEQSTDSDFTMNQQLVLDNKAIFMPNGTWIIDEMAKAPRAEGFEWGMTAIPAVDNDGTSYSYSWIEQTWIPSQAENIDAAKQFIAFLYSDEACAAFAEAGAVQPVLGIADKLEGNPQLFYSIYDNGAKAAMGYFASYESEAGLGTIREIFLDPMTSLVNGDITLDDWHSDIVEASGRMRANLK